MGPDVQGAAAALGHLEAVAQQGEAGHIGAAVHRVVHQHIPGCLVQGGHLPVDALQHRRFHQLRLGGGGDDPHAQRLCEQQHVAGSGAAVGEHLIRVDKARHRQAVDGLGPVDGMPAGDDRPRLVGLGVAAPQDLVYRVLVHGFGQAHDVQRGAGLAAHGVHVAQGIGRRDLAEEIWVIHDGREKVRGLHQGHLVGDYIDAGIVAFVVAHDEPGVVVGFKALQHAGQRARAHLGPAARAAGQLCKLYLGFHQQRLLQLPSAR